MRLSRTGLALACAAVSAAVWIWLVRLPAPSGRGLEGYDLYHYFYPAAVYLAGELRQGRFPLWNPHQLAGQPFLALQMPGALYPPNLALLWLASPARALELHFVLHVALAGWFTWKFAAQLGLSAAARAAAALAYMLSGPTLFAGIYLPAYLSTQAWLPALLLAVHRLAREPGLGPAVALGAFAALAYLGGYAQGLFYALQLAGLYGLFALATVCPPGRRGRALAWAGVAGCVAAGLAGPQLLPALELVGRSVRSTAGLDLAQADFGAFAPGQVLRGLVGLPTPGPPELLLGVRPWIVALPALSLPLAAWGWRVRERRSTWAFFLFAGAGVALLMLGTHTPVFGWYFATPGGDWFRAPSRASFVYVFAAGILAGFGVEGVRRSLAGTRVGSRGATAIAAGIAAALAIELVARVEVRVGHPAVRDPGRGASPALVEALRAHPYDRVFVAQPQHFADGSALLYKLGSMNGLFAVPDYEPSVARDYELYFAPRTGSLPWHADVELLPLRLKRTPDQTRRLLDAMSVRHYALLAGDAERAAALADFTGASPREIDGVLLFERPQALPRAYAVTELRFERDAMHAVERVLAPGFDALREAVVEAAPARAPLVPRARDAADASDRVRIEAYGAHEVSLDVDCRAECLIVLTDLAYPGWLAFVDGAERPVERVNGLYRGVRVEAGRHRVVHRFEPRSLRWGIAGAAASAVLVAALAVRGGRRARLG